MSVRLSVKCAQIFFFTNIFIFEFFFSGFYLCLSAVTTIKFSVLSVILVLIIYKNMDGWATGKNGQQGGARRESIRGSVSDPLVTPKWPMSDTWVSPVTDHWVTPERVPWVTRVWPVSDSWMTSEWPMSDQWVTQE